MQQLQQLQQPMPQMQHPGVEPAAQYALQYATPPSRMMLPEEEDEAAAAPAGHHLPAYVPYEQAEAGHDAAPEPAVAWRDIRGCITPPSVRDRDVLRGSITPPAIPAQQSPGSNYSDKEESDGGEELDSPLKPADFAAWRGGPPAFPRRRPSRRRPRAPR